MGHPLKRSVGIDAVADPARAPVRSDAGLAVILACRSPFRPLNWGNEPTTENRMSLGLQVGRHFTPERRGSFCVSLPDGSEVVGHKSHPSSSGITRPVHAMNGTVRRKLAPSA